MEYISREDAEKMFPSSEASEEEKIAAAKRLAEMALHDKNVQGLMKLNPLSDASPVTGKAGLDTMMLLGATANNRWLPYRKGKSATTKKGKKERNRTRSAQASASRKKNRR